MYLNDLKAEKQSPVKNIKLPKAVYSEGARQACARSASTWRRGSNGRAWTRPSSSRS